MTACVLMTLWAGQDAQTQAQPPATRLEQRLERRVDRLEDLRKRLDAANGDRASQEEKEGRGTVVARAVEVVLSRILDAPVKVKGVHIDTKEEGLQLTGLAIGNPEGFSEGDAILMDKAVLQADVKSLFGDEPLVRLVEADGIVINSEMSLQKGSNLKKLLGTAMSLKKDKPKIGEQFKKEKRWRVEKGVLGGLTLNMTTDFLQRKTTQHKLDPMEFGMMGPDGKGLTSSEAVSYLLKLFIEKTEMFGGKEGGSGSPLVDLVGTIVSGR